MQKFFIGIICGVLICGFALVAYADQPIAIIVNGQTIQSEVAPMIVDGRIMVPTRVIAEALGADVQWDGVNNAVVINTTGQTTSPIVTPPVVEETITATGTTRQDPIPAGQTFLCSDGVKVKVTGITKGAAAWAILKEANMYNDAPESGMQYVLVQLEAENVSYESYDGKEEVNISGGDFSLLGSSSVIYHTFDKAAVQPDTGVNADFTKTVYHGGKTSGAACFYIPANETNLILVYKPILDSTYFEIE